MKFLGNIFAVVVVAFLAYMAIDFNDKDDVPVKAKTPTFSQFMTCDIGENWSNRYVMVDEWNDMEVSGMSMALGHRAYAGDDGANDGTVSWQLLWDSKQKADAFWNDGPSDEFKAWADRHRSVMVCDGEGIRNYDVDFPRPADKVGEWDGDGAFVSVVYQCNSTTDDVAEGKQQMKALYSEFLDYVDNEDKNASWHIWSKTGKRGPYNFAVYTHNGENPDPFMDYDFYWMNYYETDAEATARLGRWVETGGDLQAKFDEFSTCEENLIYTNSAVLFPDLDE